MQSICLVQEEAENTKFTLEQRVQQLETDLAAANTAKAATSSPAASRPSSSDPQLAETRAQLETAVLQLIQLQQQHDRVAADRYKCIRLADLCMS